MNEKNNNNKPQENLKKFESGKAPPNNKTPRRPWWKTDTGMEEAHVQL